MTPPDGMTKERVALRFRFEAAEVGMTLHFWVRHANPNGIVIPAGAYLDCLHVGLS
jgi:hypothetical protein